MKLNELLNNIPLVALQGNDLTSISGVDIDSRKIKPGYLFVAIRGTQADGHLYIPKAIEQGAVAVMCEEMPEAQQAGVTYIQVESTEEVVGQLATNFYGNPTSKLRLVGVTGTNGKTTIATLYIICSENWATSVVCFPPCATISTKSPCQPTTLHLAPSS